MSPRAHILAATANKAFAEGMAARLGPYGYSLSHADTAADAIYQARATRPDIIVAMEPLESGAVELGRQLRSLDNTSDLSLILVSHNADGKTASDALDAGFDDLLEEEVPDDVLLARLHPLLRASTMHSELRQRSGIARVMGLTVPGKLSVTNQKSASLLIHEKRGALALHFDDAEFVATARDPYVAEDKLDHQSFDVAVLRADDDLDQILDLCRRLRNNPRLHNLPVVLLADLERLGGREPGYKAGASLVLSDKVDPEFLRPITLAFARRSRTWRALDRALDATRSGPTRDRQTGAYSRSFLDSYLDGRVTLAHSFGRPLSLLMLRFSNIEELREEVGDDAVTSLQERLAAWIDSLLRIEDPTAYLGNGEFCVVLPDTTQTEAQIVRNRLTGVLTQTEFAIPDVFRPVRVWVDEALVELRRGESGQDLIARARGALG